MTNQLYDAEPTARHLRFPVLHRIVLRGFSLYGGVSQIDLKTDAAVFCLAGANGLGKSTFVAALDFALTGRVPSDRPFNSAPEYYAGTKTFTESYFAGRINADDFEAAEIEVEFVIGLNTYSITRGVDEPDSLRLLNISPTEATKRLRKGRAVDSPSDVTPSELNAHYKHELTRDTGLETFEQYVFLQHFLLTFDERRQLTFWNPPVLEQLLFLAVGLDAREAERAESLRRTWERQDSLSRNRSWQASELRRRIEDLENILAQSNDSNGREDFYEEHRGLLSQRQEIAEEIADLLDAKTDADASVSGASALLASTQMEYELAYVNRQRGSREPRFHPALTESIAGHQCQACGSHTAAAMKRIEAQRDSTACFVCGTKLAAHDREENATRTQSLTALLLQVRSARTVVEAELRSQDRVSGLLEARRVALRELDGKIARFERENDLSITLGGPSLSEDAVANLRVQMSEMLDKRDEARYLRDRARNEWRELQIVLQRAYSLIEHEFVNQFSALARSFLGLNVGVTLEASGRDRNLSLTLTVDDTPRRLEHQLSESQRFFVDIALRMAMAKIMTGSVSPATMLIDTPEGSLDIAYERQAGEMFASFAESSNRIIMTANINTSQLLLHLAERCGHNNMRIERMTGWSNLSEVQLRSETLFDETYDAIAAKLRSTTPSW